MAVVVGRPVLEEVAQVAGRWRFVLRRIPEASCLRAGGPRAGVDRGPRRAGPPGARPLDAADDADPPLRRPDRARAGSPSPPGPTTRPSARCPVSPSSSGRSPRATASGSRPRARGRARARARRRDPHRPRACRPPPRARTDPGRARCTCHPERARRAGASVIHETASLDRVARIVAAHGDPSVGRPSRPTTCALPARIVAACCDIDRYAPSPSDEAAAQRGAGPSGPGRRRPGGRRPRSAGCWTAALRPLTSGRVRGRAVDLAPALARWRAHQRVGQRDQPCSEDDVARPR
jgi:hypothetical protein